jgi:hypothetical protein
MSQLGRFIVSSGNTAGRNFALRAERRLVIVCPVNDGSDITGVGIFAITPDGPTPS